MDQTARDSRKLLVLLTIAFAFNLLDRHILSITLNDIGKEFDLSDLQLGSLSGLTFAVIFVTLGFPVAKMSKIGNRKKLVVGAISIWSVMTALTATASNYVSLFLLRIGVGVGEAGFTPPAHAMIAASYPEEKRGSALSFFSAGANVGLFLSFLVGGIIASLYGWRAAFLIAGLPGLVLATIIFVLLKEPLKDIATSNADTTTGSFRNVFKTLLSQKGTRHAMIGAILTSMVGFGALTWIATFLARSHDMSPAQAGIYLAVVIGIGGALGSYLGGVWSDRLGLKNPAWRLKFVCLVIVVAKPLSIAFYTIDNTTLALIVFIVPAITGTVFTGPMFAYLYTRVKQVERPLVTAIMMFLLNLVGLGLGPVLVGGISDLLSQGSGEESLRYALAILQIFGLWGAFHFWIAGLYSKSNQTSISSVGNVTA